MRRSIARWRAESAEGSTGFTAGVGRRSRRWAVVASLAAALSLEHCASWRHRHDLASIDVAPARGGGPRSGAPREGYRSERDDHGGPRGFRARGGIPPYGRWGWMYLPAMEFYGGRG